MKNFWGKTKAFLSQMWNGLTKAGRVLFGLIAVALVILVVFATAKNTDENKHEEISPEITQVYEPSIGTPLPADNPGAVGGATTTEPSTTENPARQPTTALVAPKSGVDPNEPVAYESKNLKFAATLPAGAEVSEESTRITFNSKQGALHYIVSVNQSSETLSEVESQLRNSPTVSHILPTTINNKKALQFNAKGYGTGIAFVSNGSVYYLLGNSNYFSTFKLL